MNMLKHEGRRLTAFFHFFSVSWMEKPGFSRSARASAFPSTENVLKQNATGDRMPEYFMVIIRWLFAAILYSPATWFVLSGTAVHSDDAWMMILEGHQSPECRTYALNTIESLDSFASKPMQTDHKETLQHLTSTLRKPWYFDLGGVNSETPKSGWVYTAKNLSLTRRIRFWTTSEPAQVDRLISIFFTEREGNLEWSETQSGYVLKSAPIVDSDGRRQISTQDTYITTRDDLMFLASTVVDDELSKTLKALLPTDMYTYFVTCRPDGLTAAERTSLLTTISLVANTRLQQRNDEDDVAYALRRLRGEVILETIGAALFDVDSATFWTRWPVDGDSQLRFGGTVVAKEGSTLASLFQSIRGHDSAIEPSLTDDVIASCKCSVSFTKPLRISAEPVVRFISNRFPQYSNLATAIRESGGVSSLLQLSDTPAGELALRGFAGESGAVRNLQSEQDSPSKPVDFVQNDAHKTETEVFTLKLGGQAYQPQIIHSLRDDNLIQLELNTANNEPKPSVSTMAFSETAPHRAILSVSANLLPGSDRREEAVSRLRGRLTTLEKIVFMSMVEWKLGHSLRKERRRPTRFAAVFVPLSSHVDPAGDWSFELNLYAEGPNLIVRGTMGRELHQAILAQALFADSILSDAKIVRKALW